MEKTYRVTYEFGGKESWFGVVAKNPLSAKTKAYVCLDKSGKYTASITLVEEVA